MLLVKQQNKLIFQFSYTSYAVLTDETKLYTCNKQNKINIKNIKDYSYIKWISLCD